VSLPGDISRCSWGRRIRTRTCTRQSRGYIARRSRTCTLPRSPDRSSPPGSLGQIEAYEEIKCMFPSARSNNFKHNQCTALLIWCHCISVFKFLLFCSFIIACNSVAILYNNFTKNKCTFVARLSPPPGRTPARA